LKNEDNWQNLSPDKWVTVFEYYVQARQQYLKLYYDALQLLKPQRKLEDEGEICDNPDFQVGYDTLDSVNETERKFLKEITPIAVRKAMSFNGNTLGVWISKVGFSPATTGPGQMVWNRGPGDKYNKIVAGPGRRLWGVNSLGQIVTFPVNDDATSGVLREFTEYQVGTFIDLCVVPCGGEVSEVHALMKDQKKLVVAFFTWDEAKPDQQAKDGWDKRIEGARRYNLKDAAPPANVQCISVAASPEGFLYLLDTSWFLWYWNDKTCRRLRAPTLISEGAKGLGLYASMANLYVFGGTGIAYKSHDDIKKGEHIAWSRIDPPGASAETTPMPLNWYYTSLNETVGGALLASIYSAPTGTAYQHRWYLWADGKWTRNMLFTAPGPSSFGAFPLNCHASFNALKDAVHLGVRP
jgi:hypothetical protein